MKHLLSTFCLLALLTRALIPAGAMPDFSSQAGSFKMKICDGMHVHTMPMSMPDPTHHQPSNDDHAPCPFAAALAFSLIILAFVFMMAAFVRDTIPLRQRFLPLARLVFFGNAGCRAPPLFS